MKDYSLNEDERQFFITKIKKIRQEEGDFYEVEFADGQKFTDIDANKDNLKKIIDKQEQQVKDGIANIGEFKKGIKKATITAGATVLGSGVVGSILMNIPAFMQINQAPTFIAIGTGVIGLCGVIPSLAKLVDNNAKVKELEKFKYRDENIATLEKAPQCPNAFAGLPKTKTYGIKHRPDPFNAVNIEAMKLTIEDLATITDNVEKSDHFQFQYKKR